MPNRVAPVLLATLVVLAASARPAAAASPASIELHGLKATPTLPFSAPQNAGLDALRVVHPANAKAGGEKLSLTAVAFPKDSGMTDAELLDYVKTTFLATSDAGKPVERTLLGKKVKGQALEKKIPSPSFAEVYVTTKKAGDKVVLAFVFLPSFAKDAEAAISAIAASLKE
jgi:hypothetical protein